jgi:VIT1/CCC1 family predicted Fe2+/Mn2+ transporter
MGASNFLSKRSQAEGSRSLSLRVAARHGFITFVSFVLIGAVLLFAYIVAPLDVRFPIATAVTLTTLFAVGAFRSSVTKVSWWRSGLEMLIVGAAAAAIAYGIGAMIAGIVDSTNSV